MRSHRGFTLIEVLVAVAIVGIVVSFVLWQGRSGSRAADLAGGAYALSIRIGELKARAIADGREYVLVLVDTAEADRDRCREQPLFCGRIVVLRDPVEGGFSITDFDAGADRFDDGGDLYFPRNSRFHLDAAASAWHPPQPFAAVRPWDDKILAACDGRACFGLRFRPDGEVAPAFPGAPEARTGFSFVLGPIDPPSAAAERRGIFVSFPTGLVKTGAF